MLEIFTSQNQPVVSLFCQLRWKDNYFWIFLPKYTTPEHIVKKAGV